MVVIQCPHCGEDVELQDGASGLFDCPYCNNEFEFEDETNIINISLRPGSVVITLFSMSILFAIVAGIIYYDSLFTGDVDSWEEAFADGLGQSFQVAIADFCLIISGILLLVSAVTYLIQQIRFRI